MFNQVLGLIVSIICYMPQPSVIRTGQFQAPPLPMWTEPDDPRSNGYKQQVAVNVNGGSPHQQDPSNRSPSGATLPRSGGNHEIRGSELKDASFRGVHSLNSRLDIERLSSDTSGEDTGEETRRKQASEIYSGSMGMFAYPGTPQRLFPGGQRCDAECPHVGSVASPGGPGDERTTRTHCAAQSSGGHAPHLAILHCKLISPLNEVVSTS